MLSYRERRQLEQEEALRNKLRGANTPERKRHWFIAAINAPLAIWFLSAGALGVWSAVFNGMQACRADAEQTLTHYQRLETEIFDRLRDLYGAILRAKSLKELIDSPALVKRQDGYVYVEFKGRTLKDLEDEYSHLANTKFGQPPIIFVERWKEPGFGIPAAMKTIHPETIPWYPFESGYFSQAFESELPFMQKYAGPENVSLIRAETLRWRNVGVPLCGVVDVARRLLTGYPSNIIEWKPPVRPKIVFPSRSK